MGRHADYLDPEAFAAEMLGTVTEQTLRTYNREIDWRESLAHRLLSEVAALKAQRDVITKPEAETGPNPLPRTEAEATAREAAADTAGSTPRRGDPNETQEFEPVGEDVPEPEPGE